MKEFLERVFKRWGYPETFISDNGPTFKGQRFLRYLRQNYINPYTTPIYHPRSNPVERRNQELKKLLRIHCRQHGEDRWDEYIEQALFTLRNRKNDAIGISPSVALLDAPLVQPGEWNNPEVRKAVHNAPQEREERLQKIRRRHIVFDRQLFPVQGRPKVTLNVGDQVLTKNPPGLKTQFGPPWAGPYRVIRVCGLNVYELNRNGTPVLVHIDDIRPWPNRAQWQPIRDDPLHISPGEDNPASGQQEEAEPTPDIEHERAEDPPPAEEVPSSTDSEEERFDTGEEMDSATYPNSDTEDPRRRPPERHGAQRVYTPPYRREYKQSTMESAHPGPSGIGPQLRRSPGSRPRTDEAGTSREGEAARRVRTIREVNLPV
ncbi:uncharacterized protein LOC108915928 [Anoplophora glabripennis]|uniref:uncharacterized protein LOC108915928 n=1 Tax=Anoplophora glabripennis TaxID=217634 RepID=UPI0008737ACE|nr:uncharacterized protein LOC108915928 [Anoplophora glabripennis]